MSLPTNRPLVVGSMTVYQVKQFFFGLPLDSEPTHLQARSICEWVAPVSYMVGSTMPDHTHTR